MYQGFRLYLGERRKIIIFGSLLTTFEGSYIVCGSWAVATISYNLKSNCHNQVKLVQILDTHGTRDRIWKKIIKHKKAMSLQFRNWNTYFKEMYTAMARVRQWVLSIILRTS